MDNLANLLSTNVRIHNMDPLEPDAIWPMNIEICICRIPIRKRDGFDPEKMQIFAEEIC